MIKQIILSTLLSATIINAAIPNSEPVIETVAKIEKADKIIIKKRLKDIAEIEKFTKNVMTLVGDNKVQDGLDIVSEYILLADTEFSVIKDQFDIQGPVLENRYGKVIGMEFIETKKIGSSLVNVVYLQKFEKYIVEWKFYFYKANDTWSLNTFRTSSNVETMFLMK